MGTTNTHGRPWLLGAAIVALVVSALSLVQSLGYWALSAANGEPARMIWVDHEGPAVTASLVGVVTLALGTALLRAARRPVRSS